MHLTDHKTIGLQYTLTAVAFLVVGFLLMLLIRWQLAWPAAPLPPVLANAVGESNAPGGFMLPEFYNQLVAMHGTVMIFLAVVPLLTGAFGNYLVPLHLGAGDMAFPRLNAASYWIYLVAGLLMLVSFFVTGGAANAGWTSYAPLAVLTTRGQDLWLIGIFLVGVSSMLNALNVITTVVRLRAAGLTFMRLSFFVWSQLVSALLLLLAFPSLQAAAILQLMDRVAGTSFFLPSGLVVNGIPFQGPSGGGNPLLWQHLFWFLGHPEVYVLILPAIGIVAEIIANNTRRPLWGYGAMVMSALFIGVMSFVVWAHHMFLTGMGTSLGAFFQITTMIISVPSVVLVTALVLSLWGGSIRFNTPMLFALSFLPMFGVGGLSGLPLGLAASDVTLHDTWYVVGHFHYVVAPGTIFAIFAGIYYWFPKVTGRTLDRRLGALHFWGSFVAMNAIFMPMFTLGLRGINRRLYDGGLQYANAQGVGPVNVHMTLAALALGLFQLPFLYNLIRSLRWGSRASDNPWDATTLEWQTSSPPPHGNFREDVEIHRGAYDYSVPEHPRDFAPQAEPIGLPGAPRTSVSAPLAAVPWSFDRRPDTRTTHVRIGIWLFLASEAMFFGSLFSAYVLLRTGSSAWPDAGEVLDLRTALLNTGLLAGATLFIATPGLPGSLAGAAPRLLASAALSSAFVAVKYVEYSAKFGENLYPSTNLLLACWFALTGVHALHVLMGIAANLWIALTAARTPSTRLAERFHATRLYWYFVDLVWLAILVAFYLV